ncbi:MAG: hypothetical protein ACK55Z_12125 [bacterium]
MRGWQRAAPKAGGRGVGSRSALAQPACARQAPLQCGPPSLAH